MDFCGGHGGISVRLARTALCSGAFNVGGCQRQHQPRQQCGHLNAWIRRLARGSPLAGTLLSAARTRSSYERRLGRKPERSRIWVCCVIGWRARPQGLRRYLLTITQNTIALSTPVTTRGEGMRIVVAGIFIFICGCDGQEPPDCTMPQGGTCPLGCESLTGRVVDTTRQCVTATTVFVGCALEGTGCLPERACYMTPDARQTAQAACGIGQWSTPGWQLCNEPMFSQVPTLPDCPN